MAHIRAHQASPRIPRIQHLVVVSRCPVLIQIFATDNLWQTNRFGWRGSDLPTHLALASLNDLIHASPHLLKDIGVTDYNLVPRGK